ncbi:MAG: hypothetical protein K2Q14_01980, partial [Gammaproteobacteria bacterium]|nr:hypothetical protein [Gammaproteobacteria bacterium]
MAPKANVLNIYSTLTKSGMTPEEIIQAQLGELREILQKWFDENRTERGEKLRNITNDVLSKIKKIGTLEAVFINGYFFKLKNLKENDAEHKKNFEAIRNLFNVAVVNSRDINLKTIVPVEFFDKKKSTNALAKKNNLLGKVISQPAIPSKSISTTSHIISLPKENNRNNNTNNRNNNNNNNRSHNEIKSNSLVISENKSNNSNVIACSESKENYEDTYNLLKYGKLPNSNSSLAHLALPAYIYMSAEEIMAAQIYKLKGYLDKYYQAIFLDKNVLSLFSLLSDINGLKKTFYSPSLESSQETTLLGNLLNNSLDNSLQEMLPGNSVTIAHLFSQFHPMCERLDGFLSAEKLSNFPASVRDAIALMRASWEHESPQMKALFVLAQKELPISTETNKTLNVQSFCLNSYLKQNAAMSTEKSIESQQKEKSLNKANNS